MKKLLDHAVILAREYNYHDWSSFMVEKPEDKPKGPHYAGVLFETRNEYSPAYDDKDRSTSYSVPEIQYFCFKERDELDLWVSAAMRSKKQFFFFYVSKLGEAKIHVDVDVSTE